MPDITQDVTVTLEVEVWCATCGRGLCGQTTPTRGGGGLRVEACEDCLSSADHAGYQRGVEETDRYWQEKADA